MADASVTIKVDADVSGAESNLAKLEKKMKAVGKQTASTISNENATPEDKERAKQGIKTTAEGLKNRLKEELPKTRSKNSEVASKATENANAIRSLAQNFVKGLQEGFKGFDVKELLGGFDIGDASQLPSALDAIANSMDRLEASADGVKLNPIPAADLGKPKIAEAVGELPPDKVKQQEQQDEGQTKGKGKGKKKNNNKEQKVRKKDYAASASAEMLFGGDYKKSDVYTQHMTPKTQAKLNTASDVFKGVFGGDLNKAIDGLKTSFPNAIEITGIEDISPEAFASGESNTSAVNNFIESLIKYGDKLKKEDVKPEKNEEKDQYEPTDTQKKAHTAAIGLLGDFSDGSNRRQSVVTGRNLGLSSEDKAEASSTLDAAEKLDITPGGGLDLYKLGLPKDVITTLLKYRNELDGTKKSSAQLAREMDSDTVKAVKMLEKAVKKASKEQEKQTEKSKKESKEMRALGGAAKDMAFNFFRFRAITSIIQGFFRNVVGGMSEWFKLSSDYAEANHLLYATIINDLGGVVYTVDSLRSYDIDGTLSVDNATAGWQSLADIASDLNTSVEELIEEMDLVNVSATNIYGNISTSTSYVTKDAKSAIEAIGSKLDELAEKRLLDPTSFKRTYATFYEMANAAGMASDKIDTVARGLTQMAYDMASLYDYDFSDAASKFQSALAGITSSVRIFGVDVSRTAADNFLLANGFDVTYNSLSRANKMIVIYSMLVNSTSTSNDDLAKSLMTPANQLRILGEQARIAARSLGATFFPILTSLLAPLILLIHYLTQATNAIMSFLVLFGGTEYKNSAAQWTSFLDNLSGSSAIDDAVNGMGDLADETARAADEAKQLLGFDEINNLTENKGSGDDTGIDLDLSSLMPDFKDWEGYIIEAFQNAWTNRGSTLLGSFVKLAFTKKYMEFLHAINTARFEVDGVETGLKSLITLFKESDVKILQNLGKNAEKFKATIKALFEFVVHLCTFGSLAAAQQISNNIKGVDYVAKNTESIIIKRIQNVGNSIRTTITRIKPKGVDSIWNAFLDSAGTLPDKIHAALLKSDEKIIASTKQTMEMITAIVNHNFSGYMTTTQKGFAAFAELVLKLIAPIRNLFGRIISLWLTTLEAMSRALQFEGMGNFTEAVKAQYREMMGLKEATTKVIQGAEVTHVLKEGIAGAREFGPLMEQIIKFTARFGVIITKVFKALPIIGYIIGVIDVLSQLPTYIEKTANGTMTLGEAITDAILRFTGIIYFLDIIKQITDPANAQAVYSFFAGIGGVVMDILLGIFNTAFAFVMEIPMLLIAFFTTMLPGIFASLITALSSFLEGLIVFIFGGLDHMIQTIAGFVGNAFSNPESLAVTIGKFLIGAIEKIPMFLGQTILNFGESMKKIAEEAGENTILGAVAGFLSGAVNFGQAVVDWCTNTINAVKDFFGIHSPSTVFADIGKNLIKGLLEGIKSLVSKIPDVIVAIGEAIGTAIEGMKDSFTEGVEHLKKNGPKMFEDFLNGLLQAVRNFVVTWYEILFTIIQSILSIFAGLFEGISEFFAELAEENKGTPLGYFFAFISSMFERLSTAVNFIISLFDILLAGIKMAFMVLNGDLSIQDALSTWISMVIDWFVGLVNSLWNLMLEIPANFLKMIVTGLFGPEIGGKICEFIDDIVEFFEDLPRKIAEAIANIPNVLKEAFTGRLKLSSDYAQDQLNLYYETGDAGHLFAEGGIVTTPTFGIFGEAGPEANIPLHGAAMKPFSQAIAYDLERFNFTAVNRYPDIAGITNELRQSDNTQERLLKEQNDLLRDLIGKDIRVQLDGVQLANSINKASRVQGRSLIAV